MTEDGWRPGRWWSVFKDDGEPRPETLWLQTSDEQEARDELEDCPGGGRLYREWRREESKIDVEPVDSVPIPLPPEPPHDRRIEALDADGQVVDRYEWDGDRWFECEIAERHSWWSVVAGAMYMGFTLRHVPAEEET